MEVIASPHRIKARKEHSCDYCGKVIKKGEEYTKATCKGDYMYDWKSCDRCKPYVQEAFENKNYDWSDGMGEQDFRDYMWEEHREVSKSWWNQN